jgi:hypothetical protein
MEPDFECEKQEQELSFCHELTKLLKDIEVVR